MTDNEIIQALECCTKGNTSDVCSDCPLLHTDICTEEENGVMKLALDLINRQKAEIEEWKKILESRHRVIDSLEDSIIGLPDQIRAEAVKEFAERLKEKFACLEYVIQTNRKTLPIERLKAEVDAVLQNGCSNVVDKILKEMVGEG